MRPGPTRWMPGRSATVSQYFDRYIVSGRFKTGEKPGQNRCSDTAGGSRMPGSRAKVRWVVVGAAVILVSLLQVRQFVQANQAPSATVKEIKLGTAKPGTMYALTVAVKDPARVQGNDAVLATVKDSQGVIDSKWLHTADLDLYLTVQPRAAGPITVSLSSPGTE